MKKSRRERCERILFEGLAYGASFWVNVHAAEDLIWNGYFDGVTENFTARADTAGPMIRIGVWRVLAMSHRKNPSQYRMYVNLIRDSFLDSHSPDRLHALESLAKLGFSKPLPDIVRSSREDDGSMKVFARWVLANSGNPGDEAALAELLDSDDSSLYGMAGYALRFFGVVRPDTYTRLRECAVRLSHDAKNRVYVSSALFVHAPPEKRNEAKRELLSYSSGEKYERYEVCEALGCNGDESDTAVLEPLLDDPDMDVRVSAANACIRIERRQHRGLSWPDWVEICAYALFMLGIGIFYLHRQKNTEDYLLGGRKINPVASGISLYATMISTISYLANPGEVIKHGPTVILLYIASLPIIYLVMGYGMIPILMRLPVTSAYEILEKPLGVGVRLFGSLIFILTRLAWMALLIFLAAKAMVVMMNWDAGLIPFIIIAVGVVTLLYSSMGGLRAVVVTDVTQFSILMLGAALTILFITVKMGGPMSWFPTSWAPTWDRFVIFSTNPHVRVTVLGSMVFTIVWWICTAGSDQMAIQRYLSTRNARAARQAFLSNNIADAAISILLGLLGFALFGFFRAHPHLGSDGRSIIDDADFLFPHYIANLLPAGISGLVVAGMLSAAMSSLSSGINSTATVVVSDFVDRFKKHRNTNTHHVRIARYISMAVGLIVVLTSSLMGKVPGNIMEVTTKTNGLFVAPLFSLFFMALFVPFATPSGTVFGSIYGFFCGGVFAFWDVITGKPGLSFLWILPISLVCSILFGMLFSLVPIRGKGFKTQAVWAFLMIIPLVVIYLLIKAAA